jgi:hypothetical protein
VVPTEIHDDLALEKNLFLFFLLEIYSFAVVKVLVFFLKV